MKKNYLIFITAILLLLVGCVKEEKETAESLAKWAINEIEVNNNNINLVNTHPSLDAIFTWLIDKPERIDFNTNTLIPTTVDTTVLLTVNVKYQGKEANDSKSFVIEAVVPVDSTNADSLANWALGEIEVAGNNINLVDSHSKYDSSFTWSVDKPELIDFSNKVLLPKEEDTLILLTVTVNYKDEIATKTKSILVKALEVVDKTNAESIAEWAIEQIEITDYHINLVNAYFEYNAIFTWTVDQPERIDFSNMKLIPTEVDIEIVLTISVNYNDQISNKSKTIIIEAMEPVDTTEIDFVAQDFINQIKPLIVKDYNLITEFPDCDGSTVTWESSHPQYFSNEGKYTAPFIDTIITISYTVTTTNPALTRSYQKNFPVYKMSVLAREEFIKNYLNENLSSDGILDKFTLFPSSIGIEGVTLNWYDANRTFISSLNDCTTYIIPNIGVDLTVEVLTDDYPIEIVVRYQTVESNLSFQMRQMTSVNLVKEMKVGWNLGNTFDSPSETAWSNPKTTKHMIDTVKAAGFNVLRFPVTWEGHFSSDGNYIIDEAWINRVQELINYAIDDNTFVILNMHHERWNSTSYQNKDRASEIMEKLWIQIGTRFANYDEHLIFEGMNEPRIYEASDSIQWGGNAEAFAVINHLNQVFVNTIRNLGGNNLYRHLMITGNGGGTSETILSNLVVPNDLHVIVSVHAYSPYDFAHDKTTVTTWSKNNSSQTNAIDSVFDRINEKFIKNNIAVIMGEFASRDKGNLESRLEWLEYYLKKATSIGVPCTWWDTGQVKTVENMTFSIFDRKTSTWLFPEIVSALMEFSR